MPKSPSTQQAGTMTQMTKGLRKTGISVPKGDKSYENYKKLNEIQKRLPASRSEGIEKTKRQALRNVADTARRKRTLQEGARKLQRRK